MAPLPPFPSLGDLLALLPPRHDTSGSDVLLVLSSLLLCCLALVTPPTPGYRLVRAGVLAPLAVVGPLNWAFRCRQADHAQTWGGAMLGVQHVLRILEMLVLFPPEQTSFRMVLPRPGLDVPKASSRLNGDSLHPVPAQATSKPPSIKAQEDPEPLIAEPVPPPWTWSKSVWALSLWLSWRGHGWNYAPPLPRSSRGRPFTRSSSRSAWFTSQISFYICTGLLYDLVRAYMNCSAAHAFFACVPGGPRYRELAHWQRAVYSACVAVRVWWSLIYTPLPFAMVLVATGGVFGLNGHMWEPWGWPPVFGGMTDLWHHPGLSAAWSTIWHQYFRRFLYNLAWIGVGEKVLCLPPSGPRPEDVLVNSVRRPSSARRRTSDMSNSGRSTPLTSGRVTPSHPVPSASLAAASQQTKKAFGIGLLLSNYIKSTLVFGLCGLLHDTACTRMFLDNPHEPLATVRWRDAFAVTPFFLVQPLALACEAIVNNLWRSYKRTHYASGAIPACLASAEKFVGFASTWLFLGYSARLWIPGLLRTGIYRREETEPLQPSLFGGLIWGRWKH